MKEWFIVSKYSGFRHENKYANFIHMMAKQSFIGV